METFAARMARLIMATFILCIASLYGDPRSAQTSRLCEGSPAFPDENRVRFCNTCVTVTARRGCFAVLIWRPELSQLGGELPLGGRAYQPD